MSNRRCVIVWAAILTACLVMPTRAADAFDIVGLDGRPMGGLEPWETPATHAETGDAGMIRRLTDILRPHIERLDRAEKRLALAAGQSGPRETADALAAEQAAIIENIVCLLGTLAKHRREVAAWNLGAQADRIAVSGEGIGPALLREALDGDAASGNRPAARARWNWCAAAWSPFEAAFDFAAEQDRMLRNLGFEPRSLSTDSAWARAALILTLRQIEDETGLRPAGALRVLVAGGPARSILDLGLGRRAARNRFSERIDALIARRAVLALFRAEHLREHTLEAGEYTYRSFHAQAETPIRGALHRGVLTAFLRPAFQIEGRSADDILGAYAFRHNLYALLDAESVQRGRRPAAERVYAPYLKLLAAFPPCLTPYRPERVNDRWIAFVEDETDPAGPAAAGSPAEDDGGRAAAVPQGVSSRRFLLQADCFTRDGKTWEWEPRAAGLRDYLDRRLDELAAAAAVRKEGRP